MNYHEMSSVELARGIRNQQFTSVQVVEHFLERIDALNPALNAIVILRADEARQKARQADKAIQRGDSTGPLHGVPMTIKETFEINGWPTTAGHGKLKDHISPRTAPAVQRLIDAGAIIVGKTNIPELAGDLQSFNGIYGTTNNPWNTDMTSGGSSGGAAAALASGMIPLELGSDLAGSIRTPAAFCGIYGLKTTYGLVPLRGHVPSAPGSLGQRDISVTGPMARHLDDIEQALDLIAGPERPASDAWSITLPAAKTSRLGDLKIATWLSDPYCEIDNEMADALNRVVDLLRNQGAHIDDTARPDAMTLEGSHALYYDMLASSMGAGLNEATRNKLLELANTSTTDDYRTRFARGATQSHGLWLKQDEKRAQLQNNWLTFFDNFDLMICPVVNTPAFPHDHSQPATSRTLTINGKPQVYMDVTVWAGLAAIAGLPALSIPIGTTESGLPLAAQLIGPAYSEKELIRIGQLIGGHLHPGGLPWPAL